MALTLICFPFAGGGASVFRGWADLLRPIEVVVAPLPARDERQRETPVSSMAPLVEDLATRLAPKLAGPYALFGHSMGALIAFELAHHVARRGVAGPRCLVVSGRHAPHLPDRAPHIHALPDAKFIEALHAYGGTPKAVLAERELMAYFMPVLRADFSVGETYKAPADPPLACPITAIGGTEDPRTTRAEIEGWRDLTSGAFEAAFVAGGHFFIQQQRDALLATLRRALDPHREPRDP